MMALPSRKHDEVLWFKDSSNVDSAAAVSLYGFMYTLVVPALSANNVLTGYNVDGGE